MRSHPFISRVAFPLLAVALAVPVARAQDTIRLSTDAAGNQGDLSSESPSLSYDGQVVCFTSDATNLVVGDTNGQLDVFVNDRAAGTVTRISVDSNGLEGNGASVSWTGRALSADGMLGVFDSDARNFDSNDTNGVADVFVHDRSSGTTVRVSVDSSGNEANLGSGYSVISADGRVVAFMSYATNLVASDNNQKADVFVHDLLTGVTERISVDSFDGEVNGQSSDPSLSTDGRYVAFRSDATNLVAGDSNGMSDVFVRDRVLGTTERVSLGAGGIEGNNASVRPSLSSDGRFVAFASSASNLVPSDTNLWADIFLVDRTTGTIVRCSVDSAGNQADLPSDCGSISSSGAFVMFESLATNLVVNDGNRESDCFVRDVQAGTTTRLSVDSNGGEADFGSYAPVLSGEELDFAFMSDADDLVGSDTNGSTDIFVHERCGVTPTRSNYGQGLAGTNGVPALTANQDPVLGTTITIDVANSLGAPTVGVLLIGVEQGAFKTKFGADVLVKPLFLIPISFSYGGDSFTGALSTDGDFCGTSVDLQALELDAGAVKGVSFTQGLELVLGR
jgi:Tol biopolymer transport system component